MQASGGFSIGFPVFENDTLTIGGEYFYNQEGFSNPSFTQLLPDPITPSTTSLPFDPQKRLAQPLYLGRHYAAAFIYLPKPGKLEDWNFSFRGIMNLSDRSVVLQTIVQVQLLTYLQLQLITTGHLGSLGELRVGDDALPTDALERQAWRNALNGGKVLPTEMLDVSLWLTLNI